jgi:hypothetical protein
MLFKGLKIKDAYNGRNKHGECGLALGSQAQATMNRHLREEFHPYVWGDCPFFFLMSLLLVVWEEFRRLVIQRFVAHSSFHDEVPGIWVFVAFWKTLFQLVLHFHLSSPVHIRYNSNYIVYHDAKIK